jgi:hypothetical protein
MPDQFVGEVDILRIDVDRLADLLAQTDGEFLKTELGEGGCATEDEHWG